MSVFKVLQDAREVIADENRWTQNAWARDADGHDINEHKPEATCFCLLGALSVAAGAWDSPIYRDAEKVLEKIGVERPSTWNDAYGRTHAEVIDLLDRAIASLEFQRPEANDA